MQDPIEERTVDEFAHAEGVSVAGVYDALADERRQTTLAVLAEASTPIDLDTVAVAVANREADPARDGVPEERVEHVRVSLHRTHLPALDEANLVDYDGAGTVAGAADDLAALLA